MVRDRGFRVVSKNTYHYLATPTDFRVSVQSINQVSDITSNALFRNLSYRLLGLTSKAQGLQWCITVCHELLLAENISQLHKVLTGTMCLKSYMTLESRISECPTPGFRVLTRDSCITQEQVKAHEELRMRK